MSANYRFDKTVFKASKAEEDKADYEYWQNSTVQDRMKASFYLISSTYDFDIEHPPSLDKSVFRAFKR